MPHPKVRATHLPECLGVRHPETLDRSLRLQVKLVTFVPAREVDRVARAMTNAGAGVIGNYTQCSFRTEGIGTFQGNADASPALGQRGVVERVTESRVEMIVDRDRLPVVVEALRRAHPYEEVAYDVYPTENAHQRFGMGAIGDLAHPTTLAAFLRRVRRALGTGSLRFTGDPHKHVVRVAVCGGSGSRLIDHAIARQADVFVTADVSFHRFQDAVGRIALVDAGHHETEYPVLSTLAGKIRESCRTRGRRTPVAVSTVRTNPVAYV